MAGTPKMQEHFLTAMDGRNAEIAGANFGRRVPTWQISRKTKSRCMTHAGNAEAISGQRQGWRVRQKRGSKFRPVAGQKLKVHKQLPANPPGNLLSGPWYGRIAVPFRT